MVKKDLMLNDLVLHEKPAKILVALKSKSTVNYASTLTKAADCTYSHTVKILDTLKRAGLVNFDKKGRVKFIKLTPTGEDIASQLDDITKKLSKIKIEAKKK